MTNTGHKASSHLICTQSAFTVCHDIGRHVSYERFFRLTLKANGHYISEIFYYTISPNVNCCQTRRWWQFCFQQDSILANHACNTLKLQGSELSTSLLFVMAFNLTAQQWSLLIIRCRDSYISLSRSYESTRLKKSNSDWLKFREAGYTIRVKRRDFVLFCFTR